MRAEQGLGCGDGIERKPCAIDSHDRAGTENLSNNYRRVEAQHRWTDEQHCFDSLAVVLATTHKQSIRIRAAIFAGPDRRFQFHWRCVRGSAFHATRSVVSGPAVVVEACSETNRDEHHDGVAAISHCRLRNPAPHREWSWKSSALSTSGNGAVVVSDAA